MVDLPTVALSIRQPWAWLIVNGFKDVENRSWPTRFRGPVLIHAGKAPDVEAARALWAGTHPVNGGRLAKVIEAAFEQDFVDGVIHRGGIVGVAEIVDCVTASASPWFVGEYGFVLRNARPLSFRPMKGALGFFRVDAHG